jgi:hypothetical protein
VTPVFALSTSEWLAVASILLGGGFLGSIISIYKARPERDSVVVTSAQNAAEIFKGLNDALYSELERTRKDRDYHERRADAYEASLRTHRITPPPIEPLEASGGDDAS